MDVLTAAIAPPSTEHLQLVEYLLLAMLVVHLGYLALVVGGTALSFLFSGFGLANGDRFAREAAKRVLESTVGRPAALFAFGLLPIPAILLLVAQLAPDFAHSPARFMAVAPVPLVLAFGFLVALLHAGADDAPLRYRLPLTAGALGLLMVGSLILCCSLSLVYDPAYWPFIDRAYEVLFRWHAVARFLQFLCLAGMAAGLRLVFAEPQNDSDEEQQFIATIRRHGSGHALAASMGLPVFLAFHSLHTPVVARSGGFYNAILVAVVLLAVGATRLWRILVESEPPSAARGQALTFIALAALAVFVQDHGARATALAESQTQWVAKTDAQREELFHRYETAMEAAHGGGGPGDAELGKQVFEKRCTTCHAFDKKVVGPPLDSVGSKYAGNLEALVEFIGNPRKIRPDFPNMPKLGLPPKELRGVAQYVLEKITPKDAAEPAAPEPLPGEPAEEVH